MLAEGLASVDSKPIWILGVQMQFGLGGDPGSAGDRGNDLARPFPLLVAPDESASENRFLNPWIAGVEPFIRGQAGQFRAGAGSAWRPVVGPSRAEDEVPGIPA